MTSTNFNEISSKIFSQISQNYFVNETVLVIYWTNQTVDSDVKFLANFNDSTLEFCNVDHVRNDDDVRAERGHVENTVIFLNDKILNHEDVRAMRNCKSWDAQSKILVLVKNVNEYAVRDTLEKFWAQTRAINVTVMSITASSVKFYTLQPYKHFTMEELLIENLFPNKIPKNFNGSVIYAATAISKPFVFLTDGINDYDGVEFRVMNEISKRLNFRIEFVNIPNGETPWYSERINNQWTGTLGLINRLEAEILFHGIALRLDRYLFAEVVAIHIIDKLSYITPVYPFSFDWRGIFIIFKLELWALLLVFLILVSSTVYILTKPGRHVYSITDAFFQVLAGLLITPTFYYHDGYLYRIFMILSSFYNLVIISLYQSCLITFLTAHGEGKQYKTLEEAVDDGLVAGLFKGVNYNTSNYELWNKIYAPGRHAYMVDFPELLRIIHYNKTMFTRAADVFIKSRSNDNYKMNGERFVFNKLDDMSEVYYVAVMASKGHPLLRLLRVWVIKLVENGLVGFWANEILRDDGEDVEFGSDEPKPLAVVHLHGILWISFGLWGLAGLVFLCEVVCGKKEKILEELCGIRWKIRRCFREVGLTFWRFKGKRGRREFRGTELKVDMRVLGKKERKGIRS